MFLYCLRLGLRFGPRYLTSWIGKHCPGPAPPFVGVPERQIAPVPIPDGGRRRRRKNVASGPNLLPLHGLVVRFSKTGSVTLAYPAPPLRPTARRSQPSAPAGCPPGHGVHRSNLVRPLDRP